MTNKQKCEHCEHYHDWPMGADQDEPYGDPGDGLGVQGACCDCDAMQYDDAPAPEPVAEPTTEHLTVRVGEHVFHRRDCPCGETLIFVPSDIDPAPPPASEASDRATHSWNLGGDDLQTIEDLRFRTNADVNTFMAGVKKLRVKLGAKFVTDLNIPAPGEGGK